MKKKSRILKSFLATASIYGTFLTSFNAAGATVITTGDSVSLNTGAGLVGGIFNDGDTIQIEANNIPTPIISADKPNVKIGEITTLINDLIFGGVEVSQNTSIGPLNAADGLNPNFGPLKFMVDNVTATITGVGNQSFSSIDFAGKNSTLEINDTLAITTAIDNIGAENNGIINLGNNTSVTQAIGNNNSVSAVNVNGTGDITLGGAVNATSLNINNADANVIVQGQITGEVLYTQPGTLNVSGDNSIIGKVNFQNVDDTLKIRLNINESFNADIDNIVPGENGIVNVIQDKDPLVANSYIKGNIGETNPIQKLVISNDSEVSVIFQLDGKVKASKIQITRPNWDITPNPRMRLTINNDVTADIEGISDGSNNFELIINSGKTVTGAIDSINTRSTTINLRGNVTGPITNATTINFDGEGDSNLGSTANSTDFIVANAKANVTAAGLMTGNLSYNAAGTVTATKGITGDVDFAGIDGTLIVGDGQTITGSVDSKAGIGGILEFAGKGAVTGGIGGTNQLTRLRFSGAGDSTIPAAKAETYEIANADANITANGPLEGDILYSADGEFVVNGVTGDVTSSAADQGTLTVNSGNVTGTIGDNKNGLKLVNIGANPVTLFSNAFAPIALTNAASDLILADNVIVNGAVTTKNDTKGILTLGTNSSVTNGIGAAGSSLAQVNIGAGASSLGGDIYAGAVQLMADDSALTLEANTKVYGSVTTKTDTKGVLVLGQNSSVAGIGANGFSLERVEVGAGASSLGGNIYAGSVSLTADDSALTLEDNAKVYGSVTTKTNEKGVLVLGQNSSANGIGANNFSLERVEVGAGASSLGGDIYAGAVQLNEETSALTLEANTKVYGSVTTKTDTKGVLILGQGSSAAGIGANNFSLERVEVGAGASSLGGEIYAGAVKLMADDSALTLEDNAKVHGSVTTNTNEKGVLVLGQNSSVAGIGANGLSLERVEVGAGASSLGGDIYAGAVQLTADDSALTLQDNAKIYGSVTTANDSRGKLIFANDGTVTDNVGAAGSTLEEIEFNGVNKIQGTANAKTFIIANANAEVTVMGLMTGNVNYEADGTLAPEGIIGDIDFKGTNGTFNINAGFAIDGAVLSTGGLGGTLNFKGDGNVTGAIGTDDENSPALISVQGDDTTNVSLVDDGSVAR